MPKHDFSKVRISKSLKQNPPSRPDLRLGTGRPIFNYSWDGTLQKRACVPIYFGQDCRSAKTLGANVMKHDKNLARSHENKTKAQLLIMRCILATAGERAKIQICLLHSA